MRDDENRRREVNLNDAIRATEEIIDGWSQVVTDAMRAANKMGSDEMRKGWAAKVRKPNMKQLALRLKELRQAVADAGHLDSLATMSPANNINAVYASQLLLCDDHAEQLAMLFATDEIVTADDVWPRCRDVLNEAMHTARAAIRGTVERTADSQAQASETLDPDDLIDAYDVATMVGIERRSLKVQEWGKPVFSGGGKGKRHQWRYSAIRPILMSQFPHLDFPDKRPAEPKRLLNRH
jgi:hypothetical protein